MGDMHMSTTVRDPEIEAYYSRSFSAVVLELHKLAIDERARALSTLAQIGKGPGKLSSADRRDLMGEIKSAQNARVAFIRLYEAGENGKKVKEADLAKAYDDYCYSVAMLEAHTDRWEAILATNFQITALAILNGLASVHKRVQASGKALEAQVENLAKLLKKAEKAKWKSYVKSGLSLAWDVVKIVSPQARAISSISDFAVGNLIDISSNVVFGKPKDFAGTSVGMMVGGAELEYKARGLEKAAGVLGKAGKALKVDGLKGSYDDIKGARAAVDDIKAAVHSLERQIKANKKLLVDAIALQRTAERDMIALVKRVQGQASKQSNAERTYKHYQKLRKAL